MHDEHKKFKGITIIIWYCWKILNKICLILIPFQGNIQQILRDQQLRGFLIDVNAVHHACIMQI